MRIRIDPSAYSSKFHNLLYSWDRYVIAYGGRGCFDANQKVITDKGIKAISSIQVGDMVKSFNECKEVFEYKPVRKLFRYKIDESVYKISYNNTEIIATFDHKFYYGGSWLRLKDIVSLWYEYRSNLEANTRIQCISCQQYRINKNIQLESQRQGSYNEAIAQQEWIFENNAERGGWEISYDICTSNDCDNILRVARFTSDSEPYKPYQNRQPNRESGMDGGYRECERSISCGIIFQSKRGASRQFDIERRTGEGDKIEIQAKDIHPGYVGERVRSESINHKRHNSSQELGLAGIESVQIIDTVKCVYDINVQDNHNYYLDCGHPVLVHNSGKTDTLILKYLLSLFEPYYFKLAYVNQEGSNIRDQQYAGFKRVAKRCGLFDKLKFYDGDYRIVNPQNGNMMVPKGMDDPEKTKGLDNITAIWWDEINKGTIEGFNALNELLRSPEAQYLQFAISFNPVSDKHWLRTKFFHPDDSHKLHPDFKGEALLNRSTYKDNEFIDQEAYLRTLMFSAAGNPNAIRVNIEGDWGLENNADPWLYAFDASKHVKPKLPFIFSAPVYLSFDFNKHPVTCTATQMSPSKGMADSFLHVIKEFHGDVSLGELCKRIQTTFPQSIFFVTGDASGASGHLALEEVGKNETFYTLIKRHLKLTDKQIHTFGKNLAFNDSRMLCNHMLHHYPNFYISQEGCPMLINDMHVAQVDEKGTDANKLKKDRDLFKMDMLDNWRYMLQRYYFEYFNKVLPK